MGANINLRSFVLNLEFQYSLGSQLRHFHVEMVRSSSQSSWYLQAGIVGTQDEPLHSDIFAKVVGVEIKTDCILKLIGNWFELMILQFWFAVHCYSTQAFRVILLLQCRKCYSHLRFAMLQEKFLVKFLVNTSIFWSFSVSLILITFVIV